MAAFAMKFIHDEHGSTAIEYALIAALITLAIVGAVTNLGGKVQQIYTNVANGMK